MKKLKFLHDYFIYLKNPFVVLLFKLGLKKTCSVNIKNFDETVDLTSIHALDKLMLILSQPKNYRVDELIKYIKDIDDDKKFVFMDNIKFYNLYSNSFKKEHNRHYDNPVEEYFFEDDWNIINFQNRFVIDIGANVADRTLYFAKHGANVIGFEPVKHLYNISLNPNLKNNITLINKAVGGGME